MLITAPKGGSAMIFAADGTPVATHRRADLCGAATHTDGFRLTNGLRALWAADDNGLTPLAKGGSDWDNHLIALTQASST